MDMVIPAGLSHHSTETAAESSALALPSPQSPNPFLEQIRPVSIESAGLLVTSPKKKETGPHGTPPAPEEDDRVLDKEIMNLSADVSASAFEGIDADDLSDLSFATLDPVRIAPLESGQQEQTTTEPVAEPVAESSYGKDKLILITIL